MRERPMTLKPFRVIAAVLVTSVASVRRAGPEQ
jgi:hypothetical protein